MDIKSPIEVTGPSGGRNSQESDAIFALNQMILVVPPVIQFRFLAGRINRIGSTPTCPPKSQ